MEKMFDFAKPDYDRLRRRGMSEVIFGSGKTAEQIVEIMQALNAAGQNAFATRVAPDIALMKRALREELASRQGK